jgi:peroxisomal 2,4-dienoyl-CoA reductase
MGVFQSDALKGKVALVTGGGSGICRGMAETLMAHGCDVAITSRKQERLDATATELSSGSGQGWYPVAADVRDADAVQNMVTKCLDHYGRLDILINGAAGNFLSPAAMLSPNGFKTVMDIDACGTFNVSSIVFKEVMRHAGGVILNVSATLHYTGIPMQVHAGAAKAAIDAMTRHLAVEWGPAKVRVNGIAPGPVDDTEGMKRLLPADMREAMEKSIPMGRFTRIAEVADAALFLVSDAARFITGQTLVVDGGAWMTAGSFRPS